MSQDPSFNAPSRRVSRTQSPNAKLRWSRRCNAGQLGDAWLPSLSAKMMKAESDQSKRRFELAEVQYLSHPSPLEGTLYLPPQPAEYEPVIAKNEIEQPHGLASLQTLKVYFPKSSNKKSNHAESRFRFFDSFFAFLASFFAFLASFLAFLASFFAFMASFSAFLRSFSSGLASIFSNAF